MAELSGHGLHLPLPGGWEGQVFRRFSEGAITHAVLHAANFPLPPVRGDFGSGAVEVMGPGHSLLVLFEHEPAAAGKPLFAAALRPLRPEDFSPNGLQRMRPGQSGTQQFFSRTGRAFTLYAVLGSHAQRFALGPALNAVLASLRSAAGDADRAH